MASEATKCDQCHERSGAPEAIYLHGRCHMAAPLWAKVEGGYLILSCYVPECRREVARFRITGEGEVER